MSESHRRVLLRLAERALDRVAESDPSPDLQDLLHRVRCRAESADAVAGCCIRTEFEHCDQVVADLGSCSDRRQKSGSQFRRY